MYSRVIFFFNDTATTEIYTYCHTLSLHAALPICKSTLFKLITGKETPDGGTIEVGDTVKLGYVDQSRDHLNPDHNVWEEISGGHDLMTIGKPELQTRDYVGAFNFKGGDQQKKVGQLSGGERNPVHLANLPKEGGNVLRPHQPHPPL